MKIDANFQTLDDLACNILQLSIGHLKTAANPGHVDNIAANLKLPVQLQTSTSNLKQNILPSHGDQVSARPD